MTRATLCLLTLAALACTEDTTAPELAGHTPALDPVAAAADLVGMKPAPAGPMASLVDCRNTGYGYVKSFRIFPASLTWPSATSSPWLSIGGPIQAEIIRDAPDPWSGDCLDTTSSVTFTLVNPILFEFHNKTHQKTWVKTWSNPIHPQVAKNQVIGTYGSRKDTTYITVTGR
jgi:hypothetical protein